MEYKKYKLMSSLGFLTDYLEMYFSSSGIMNHTDSESLELLE